MFYILKEISNLLFKNKHSTPVNCFDVICNVTFKEHLPEDDHNRQPKHVAGYAVYTTISLHICIYTCWSCVSQRNLKLAITGLALAKTTAVRTEAEMCR
jgi:hypothetical protein